MLHARTDYRRIQDLAAVAQMLDEAIAAIGEDTFEGQSLVVFKEQLEARYGPLTGVEPIPEGEPVFLLRAQDLVAPSTVRTWATAAYGAGADDLITATARAHADLMEDWQRDHGFQVPDMPASPAPQSIQPRGIDSGEKVGR